MSEMVDDFYSDTESLLAVAESDLCVSKNQTKQIV